MASSLPAGWDEILEHVDQSLTEAVTAMAGREESLQESDPPAPPLEPSARREIGDERLSALKACAERAAAGAAEADAALAAAQHSLNDWLAAAQSPHAKLAKAHSPCVSYQTEAASRGRE